MKKITMITIIAYIVSGIFIVIGVELNDLRTAILGILMLLLLINHKEQDDTQADFCETGVEKQ